MHDFLHSPTFQGRAFAAQTPHRSEALRSIMQSFSRESVAYRPSPATPRRAAGKRTRRNHKS